MSSKTLFSLLALALAPGAHSAWKTFTFDGTSKYQGTAVAAGKDGSLFVLGVDGNKYITKYTAVRAGAAKSTDLGFTTDQADIAVDSSGNAHMITVQAFKDKSNPQDLVYALDDGKTVKQEVLDDVAHYYWVPSLTLDRNGKPHVSAYMKFYPNGDPARDLIYFKRGDDGKWKSANLDSSANETAKFSGIAVDSKLKAHIAYIDVSNGRLHYAAEKDTGWSYNDIGSGNWTRKGSFVRTVVTPDDVPHVVYITEASGSGADTASVLEMAEPDTAGGWKTTVLDTIGVFSFAHRFGLALDKDGKICIAYRKNADRSLRFLRISGPAAASEVVDTAGNTGFNAYLATAPDGNLYVTYTNQKGELRLATTDESYKPVSILRGIRKAGKGASLRSRLQGGRGPSLILDIASDRSATLSVELLDVKGAKAADLGAARIEAGTRTLTLPLPALERGVYLVRLREGGMSAILGRVTLSE